MFIFKNTLWFKRIAILVSFIIVSLILWNTYIFFRKFKHEERNKMELFASALRELSNNQDLNADLTLEVKIIENSNNIPSILTDEKGTIISHHNLDDKKSLNNSFLQKELKIMKDQNPPIEISYKNSIGKQYIYYRNSDLLYKLTYYPIALILILGLFLSVIYLFFNSNKIAEQNKLWAGMARETAHQIGTPLSSLLGWIAILRSENVKNEYVSEIEKDVNRLNVIANRFSKIGSLPKLEPKDIVNVTETTFKYLQSRSSKQVAFHFEAPKKPCNILLNNELFGWVIENLIKNAIDAMAGKGTITLQIHEESSLVKIVISDTGKGLQKSQFKQIFKPGFTTKKRGWGLGLSLSKRIIENYHKGKIFVKKSEIGKGTTFEIQLHKITRNHFS